MWLPPSRTKEGLRCGGEGEASIAPYSMVWDPSGSAAWLGLFAWDATGGSAFRAPALLGESPAKIIQREQSGWRQGSRQREGCLGQGRS